MKRVPLLLIILFIGGLAIFELSTFARCDGWYDLTVDIDSETIASIDHISYVGAHNADMADACISMIDDLAMKHREAADSFTVRVGYSYRASPLGRTWRHGQEYSHLIVVLHLKNGTRTIHRLPVPHRTVSRRIVLPATTAT